MVGDDIANELCVLQFLEGVRDGPGKDARRRDRQVQFTLQFICMFQPGVASIEGSFKNDPQKRDTCRNDNVKGANAVTSFCRGEAEVTAFARIIF